MPPKGTKKGKKKPHSKPEKAKGKKPHPEKNQEEQKSGPTTDQKRAFAAIALAAASGGLFVLSRQGGESQKDSTHEEEPIKQYEYKFNIELEREPENIESSYDPGEKDLREYEKRYLDNKNPCGEETLPECDKNKLVNYFRSKKFVGVEKCLKSDPSRYIWPSRFIDGAKVVYHNKTLKMFLEHEHTPNMIIHIPTGITGLPDFVYPYSSHTQDTASYSSANQSIVKNFPFWVRELKNRQYNLPQKLGMEIDDSTEVTDATKVVVTSTGMYKDSGDNRKIWEQHEKQLRQFLETKHNTDLGGLKDLMQFCYWSEVPVTWEKRDKACTLVQVPDLKISDAYLYGNLLSNILSLAPFELAVQRGSDNNWHNPQTVVFIDNTRRWKEYVEKGLGVYGDFPIKIVVLKQDEPEDKDISSCIRRWNDFFGKSMYSRKELVNNLPIEIGYDQMVLYNTWEKLKTIDIGQQMESKTGGHAPAHDEKKIEIRVNPKKINIEIASFIAVPFGTDLQFAAIPYTKDCKIPILCNFVSQFQRAMSILTTSERKMAHKTNGLKQEALGFVPIDSAAVDIKNGGIFNNAFIVWNKPTQTSRPDGTVLPHAQWTRRNIQIMSYRGIGFGTEAKYDDAIMQHTEAIYASIIHNANVFRNNHKLNHMEIHLIPLGYIMQNYGRFDEFVQKDKTMILNILEKHKGLPLTINIHTPPGSGLYDDLALPDKI